MQLSVRTHEDVGSRKPVSVALAASLSRCCNSRRPRVEKGKKGGRGVGCVEKGWEKDGQSEKGSEKGVSLLKRTCS